MSTRWRKTALVLAAILALSCLTVIFVVLQRLSPDATTKSAASSIDAPQIVESANVALAYLENHDSQQSAPLFARIAEALPLDPLGPRNLAVAQVLALGEDFERATPEGLAEARSALAGVYKTEGASTEWHWLSARVAAAADDDLSAAEHLSQIVDAEPRNASAWYELFLMRRAPQDPGARWQASAALAHALALEPGNLFLLVEYLRELEDRLSERFPAIERLPPADRAAARRAAMAEHGDVAALLRQARQTLNPFQDRLLTIGRVDILQQIDEAAAAAQEGDLQQLGQRAGQAGRILLGVAAPDRNRIRRHVLEFVLVRFRPEFYVDNHDVLDEAPPATDVAFSDQPAQQIGDQLRRQLNDVRAVELADFDLDGRLDIILLDAAGVRVFARSTTTDPWKLIADAPQAAGMTGLVVQDFDLDFDEMPPSGPRSNVQVPRLVENGAEPDAARVAEACASADVDVLAFGPAGVVMLRNRFTRDAPRRSLEPVEQAIDAPGVVSAASAADVDADGDLDLALAGTRGVSIWSNRGNATFEDISSRSSFPPPGAKVSSLSALDWDRDVDVDLLLGGEPSGWLENMRHGQMRWHSFDEAWAPLRSARDLESINAGTDASWVVVAARGDGLQLVRTLTPQSGIVRPIDAQTLTGDAADHVRSFDYDNDGFMDLLAFTADRLAIYRGLPDGRFQPVEPIDRSLADIRDCQLGDLDGDGDVDVVVAAASDLVLLDNQGGNKNHWLNVALKARQIKGAETSASGRVNASGIGCLLELKAGPRYAAAVVRGQTTHFGLGKRASADVVRILWLNGVPQNIIQPPAIRAVCEQQLLTGSCPYLYTWNGKSFQFVTDLLWAAPLGLQAAEGVLLPWREWEYVKIPGQQLRAQSGEYILQLTEELWEAAYFDHVKLIAVDHPPAVDVYTNEKVGPPDIARFKIHTVSAKRTPVAARNHRGRDLLPALAAADGDYAKPFDTKLRQGLVEEHSIELDLGDLHDARHVTLFLTGWIYPSGTSLNVAFSQNPDLPRPKPPVLLVPDGRDGWKEALPYMGFPGGKTKTIAVDVSQALTPLDSRIRIATNLELYWDQIFFTVDEPPVELRQTELVLRSADLHWRGFSRIERRGGNGPERFTYDDASTQPKWPPMQGRFTRYGDVLPLLQQRDDRLLVLGAGDEATLRFAAPADDPPPGWQRDFILYSVGWDKDANLCTITGDTAEPLPFAAMKNYPPTAGDQPPRDAEYLNYLQKYQTRRQPQTFWRALSGD